MDDWRPRARTDAEFVVWWVEFEPRTFVTGRAELSAEEAATIDAQCRAFRATITHGVYFPPGNLEEWLERNRHDKAVHELQCWIINYASSIEEAGGMLDIDKFVIDPTSIRMMAGGHNLVPDGLLAHARAMAKGLRKRPNREAADDISAAEVEVVY